MCTMEKCNAARYLNGVYEFMQDKSVIETVSSTGWNNCRVLPHGYVINYPFAVMYVGPARLVPV